MELKYITSANLVFGFSSFFMLKFFELEIGGAGLVRALPNGVVL